ncbi:MAG: dolichol-phosphate mannosyltransferase [Microbacteriaceae bacterium]|nr:dolichol-phosphate mannosyltransferase [Microbacteriaceae bacterium]
MTLQVSGAGTLVIVPTYNEAENVAAIVGRALAALPEGNVLIVDDGSPDGTGDIADAMATADPRIHVLHRSGKQGLGAAYIAGFGWGLERSYDVLVEMDADGSHPPEKLPVMLAAANDTSGPEVGLVIGSRWTKGGEVVNWPKRREALSRGANTYAGIALGISVKDATAGFRVYRSEVLRDMDLTGVDSKGYCFQIDLTLRTLDAGYRIVEVPITFRDREFGESKMNGSIVTEAMSKVTLWGFQRRARQVGRLFRRTPAA